MKTALAGQETIEDVVLRHSRRGMTVLRGHMEADYCQKAARQLLALPRRTILLTTGFYVAGHAETDGPLGTVVLARALESQGFRPVIVTDQFCRGFFESVHLDVYEPVALISIERCGRNTEDDYANMRGVSIREHTAQMDWLFIKARKRGIPTFGVGDGGNEIGMGNLRDVIAGELELVPCRVRVDTLVIATVSNWGAYAVAAYIQKLTGIRVLPKFSELKEYLARIVEMGSVDGVTKEHTLSVDGFSLEVEREILDGLKKLAAV